jgi:tetratricopeptide (TPR) repeat protein
MQFRRLVPHILLLAWAAVLYFPGLANPFVYDDLPQIVRNPHLKNPSASLIYFREPALFDDAFGTQSGSFYRPLFWMSLVSDKEIGRQSPEFFHATNILIHALNGILVFLLLRRWFAGPLPLVGALAWLSLPIHTEVVAWISGRGLALATFFILLSVLAALKFSERSGWKYLLLLVLASCAALLSHETGVVAPLLATFAIFWASGASERWRSTVLVFVASTVPLLAYIVLRMVVFHTAPLAIQPLKEILLQGPVSIAKYVWWTMYPPAMSMERSTELIDLTFQSWTYAAAMLTIVSIAAAAILLRRSPPLFAAGFACAAIALLPFAQILKLYQSVAERYAYTTSIGTVLAITALLAAAQAKLRLPAWSAATVLAAWIALSVLPLQARVRTWSSESTLYTISLSATPKSALLHQNLGVLDEEAGNLESAANFFRAAILLRPSYLQAHMNLANLCMRSGRLAEAAAEFKHVLEYDPGNLGARLNLSNVLATQGDSDSALALLTRVVQEHPESYEAELGLGIVLHQKKDPTARDHFEKALQLKPDSAATAFNLGMLEEGSGHFDAARKLYEQVLRYHPGDIDAVLHLQRLAGRNH